jgi:hypothetical protein
MMIMDIMEKKEKKEKKEAEVVVEVVVSQTPIAIEKIRPVNLKKVITTTDHVCTPNSTIS